MTPEPVNEFGVSKIFTNKYETFRKLRQLPTAYNYGRIITPKYEILYYVELFK
jgi:hypothetical protein